MVEIVDSVIVVLSQRKPMTDEERKYFAAHTEIQDAAKVAALELGAPAAATIEIAKILTRFDDQIDDDWRALLITIGGALLRLDQALKESGDG